jgi:UDP-glucose 4-epimerase
MKKVLVTGGAGFIGSHLAEELHRRDYHVTILDDLSSGKKENIQKLLDQVPDKVQFVEDSVTNYPLVLDLCKGVDYVFHLAAIASVPSSINDPATTHNVNLTGTLNILQAAKENKSQKVVFISSAAVYGDNSPSPQREDCLPAPMSPYAVTKLAGEYYCNVYQQAYQLSTACLRYFNIYGPRQNPNSQYAAAIPIFIRKALDGEKPVIFGDGEQTRDFVFVTDAVKATIQAAESVASGIYNIGGGQSVTINDLVKIILKIINNNIEASYEQARPGDILHSLADISKARMFGYTPGYSLEAGLKETIRHFQNM